MSDMVKVYTELNCERAWLQDVLDDNGIPYEVEYENYWVGIKITELHKKIVIYVDKIYEDAVNGFIEEYRLPQSVVESDLDARQVIDDEDELLQVSCAACGKSFDFDSPKCPHCGRSQIG